MQPLFNASPEVLTAPVAAAVNSEVAYIKNSLDMAKRLSDDMKTDIIDDVCKVLGCRPSDLDFMFRDDNNNASNAAYDFPDSERRRFVIENNHLDAAE